MKTSRDFCLGLVLGLLVTIPVTRVTAICNPIDTTRTTVVVCLAAGCTPTPPGTVDTIVVTQVLLATGTCSIANDLTVTLTNGAVACMATVTSCDGGTVVTTTDDDDDDDSTDDSAGVGDDSDESVGGSDSR